MASPIAPSVQVQAAHIEYNGQTIIDNLSVTLGVGQWTCLLGPSGVGKTTLLRLIAGLLDDEACHARAITAWPSVSPSAAW